ncbi:MAG: monofunctional biosynthetic peptidoglycan transglycosylase [Bordetella sp.]|uniref:monofunctional biosynthetic peptidoglycan transglycosylase n=1 Tax=Bordetella sp. TaxID=28081 RepID=UPI003F7BF30A
MAGRKSRRMSWPARLALSLIGVFLLYQLWMLGQVLWYAHFNPGSSAVMREEMAVLRKTDPRMTLQHAWVPYDRISNSLKRAVVASEDANFLDNNGVEWDAIREAWIYNQRQEELGRKARRGGSTITQQLAKNLLLSNSRNYLRKGEELLVTFMIDRIMSKRRILEIYLNIAEWGTGVFGAQAAARHYFQIDASQLGAYQAAKLACMLPNPRYYDKHRNTRYLDGRAGIIAERMRQVDIP